MTFKVGDFVYMISAGILNADRNELDNNYLVNEYSGCLNKIGIVNRVDKDMITVVICQDTNTITEACIIRFKKIEDNNGLLRLLYEV